MGGSNNFYLKQEKGEHVTLFPPEVEEMDTHRGAGATCTVLRL